jgi:hypothetical protein
VYDFLLWLNRHFNWLRGKFGAPMTPAGTRFGCQSEVSMTAAKPPEADLVLKRRVF